MLNRFTIAIAVSDLITGLLVIPRSASITLKDILFLYSLNYKLCETGTHTGALAVPKTIGSWAVTPYERLQ